MKLKGFRSPPKILYEAYLRAKIKEAVMEKHDSTLDSPKGEQLMKENEGIEAEHNDIITNLKDESVVNHMFDGLCQRTPMDFLEENQHKTLAREYQEEKAKNQVFDRLAHNDCVISQGLSYELLTGELGWQQGSIDKEIFNSASPLHCPRNWSSVSREVKQKFTEVKINWNQLSCSGYRFGNCSSYLKSMLSSKLVKMDNDEQKLDGAVNIVPLQQSRPLNDLIFDPGGGTKIEMNKDCNDSKFGAVSMQGIFYIAIVEHLACLIQGLPKLSKDYNPNVAVDEYCSVSSFWIVKNIALGVKKDANAFIFVFNPGEVILLENFSNGQLKYVQECSFKLLERRCPQKGEVEKCTTVIYGVRISILQLSTLAICGHQSKIVIMEVGESELLNEKSSQSLLWCSQIDFSKDNNTLVYGILPAIVFQDRDIIQVHAPVKAISVLANFLELKEGTNRYFGLQFLASLACNGYIGILLSVSNPGVTAGLLTLLGCVDANLQDLLKAVEKFLGLHYPDQVALKRLYMVGGATSRISALVAQLKLIPGPDFESDGQFRTLKVVNIWSHKAWLTTKLVNSQFLYLILLFQICKIWRLNFFCTCLWKINFRRISKLCHFLILLACCELPNINLKTLFGSLELCLTSLRTRIV
ncbi:uncharacterized protein [Coffea arabica]|uniref:Uncharacterized protein n=1 Tax=Coffea arabica TaxID=13443 RepID=A0ABM4UHK5_COFAR